MSWTSADIPDLTGRTAVVTGATSGLGRVTAIALAGAGAHVVLAARNLDKAAGVAHEILRTGGSTSSVELDLGSLASVRQAADAICADHPTLDILVNNAGLMATPEGRTEDGFETQFGVNHLGHWALTATLLGPVLAADAARVVTVTSTAHHMGRAVDPDDTELEGHYRPWEAYGRSKLANYHFAIGLDRAFREHRASASSLVAHPGLSHTNLQVATREGGGAGSSGRVWEVLAARMGMTPERGALPQLRAATDPAARGGQMYAPRWVNFGPPVRRPILRRIGLDHAIEVLWDVSERLTGVGFDFERARLGS